MQFLNAKSRIPATGRPPISSGTATYVEAISGRMAVPPFGSPTYAMPSRTTYRHSTPSTICIMTGSGTSTYSSTRYCAEKVELLVIAAVTSPSHPMKLQPFVAATSGATAAQPLVTVCTSSPPPVRTPYAPRSNVTTWVATGTGVSSPY